VSSHTKHIQLSYVGRLRFLICIFCSWWWSVSTAETCSIFVQAVKVRCIRWQYNNNTNSHFLDINMTSKPFDQNLCVVSFIEHDSCVCLSWLGMLIDLQNMNASVHVAWYFEVRVVGSNSILGMNIRGSLCYDARSTTTNKPSASVYLFSALFISVNWGTHWGMRKIWNMETQQTNLKRNKFC